MFRTQTALTVLALLTAFSFSANAQDGDTAPVEEPVAAPTPEPTPEPTPTRTTTSSSSTPAPAAAPGGSPLQEGALSLSLGIPAGGNPYASGAAGLFYAFSSDVNMGIYVGLGLDTAGNSEFNLLLAPVFKFYLAPGAEITPFWIGQANVGITSAGNDPLDFSIMGGFGAEWFVTNIFSVAGYFGLGIDILRPNDTDPLRMGTFTSGLSAQLYF